MQISNQKQLILNYKKNIMKTVINSVVEQIKKNDAITNDFKINWINVVR